MESSPKNKTSENPSNHSDEAIVVEELTLAHGGLVLIENMTFTVNRGEIFVIMGESGCGKSTLMRHMIGLHKPHHGRILYNGADLIAAPDHERLRLLRSCGVLYQHGALWSSMTLLENVSLPLEEFASHSKAEIESIARLKLSLVGLRGFEEHYPAEISGGMRKRAALARAMALDPEFLFLDEPSAGLDPVTSRNLDELILRLREALGCTIVLVTHELESIFAIADRSLYLDARTREIGGLGPPDELRKHPPNKTIEVFLSPRKPARSDQ